MSLYLKECLPDTGITYAIWKIEEDERELTSLLPDGENLLQQAHKQFGSSVRRLEWLSVRRLFHELGYRHSDIRYYPTGRPYVAGSNLQISISHTRGYVAIALQKESPIGIDIEQMGEKVYRVRAKFLSSSELASIAHDSDEIKNLLIHWSAKESIFKLIDHEGIDFAEHLHILPYTISNEGFIHGTESFTDKGQKFHIKYRLFSDFVLTVAQPSQ